MTRGCRPWFVATVVLLGTQLFSGFVMAIAHAGYDPFHHFIPLNTARAAHLCLLQTWAWCGLLGACYAIVPIESGRELAMRGWLPWQLAVLILSMVTAITLFHFNIWDGREFFEAPWPFDVAVGLVSVSALVALVRTTGRRPTVTSAVLLAGLIAAIVAHGAGAFALGDPVSDANWGQTVVRLWFEFAWFAVAAGLTAFLCIAAGRAERRAVERVLVVVVAMIALATALRGTDAGIGGGLQFGALMVWSIGVLGWLWRGPSEPAFGWLRHGAVWTPVAGALGALSVRSSLGTTAHAHLAVFAAIGMPVLAIVTHFASRRPELAGVAVRTCSISIGAIAGLFVLAGFARAAASDRGLDFIAQHAASRSDFIVMLFAASALTIGVGAMAWSLVRSR